MVSIQWARNRQEGTCNACTKWIGKDGTIDGDVLMVHLDKGSSMRTGFRVCADCARELIAELTAALTRDREPAHDHQR